MSCFQCHSYVLFSTSFLRSVFNVIPTSCFQYHFYVLFLMSFLRPVFNVIPTSCFQCHFYVLFSMSFLRPVFNIISTSCFQYHFYVLFSISFQHPYNKIGKYICACINHLDGSSETIYIVLPAKHLSWQYHALSDNSQELFTNLIVNNIYSL